MFSTYSKSDSLEEVIAEIKEIKIQKSKHLTLVQEIAKKYENDLLIRRQRQSYLEKNMDSLTREIQNTRLKLEKKRLELLHLCPEDMTKKIMNLESEIVKIQEENSSLVTKLNQLAIKVKPDLSHLRSPILQEQIKQLEEQNLRIEREIQEIDEDCLSLQLEIKTKQEQKKLAEEELEQFSRRADYLEENLSMLHVLDMNISDLLKLFYMTRDKEFETVLHWYIGWFAYFNQDFYQAANHLYMAVFIKPELYQTKKLEYIEVYLKTKGLWFDDVAQNYNYYLKRKYGSKPCSIEELIFWANRVIFSETKLGSEADLTVNLELSYEMLSDLMEYSARQNDWNMVDGTYSALGILSEKSTLFLCHLLAIVKPTCDYVDTLFLEDNKDNLYLYYLPKMMLSYFYQQHIKPIKPDFWENEEKKVASYRPSPSLTQLENVMMTLNQANFKLDALYFAWVPELALQAEVPVILRVWCLCQWAMYLIEKNAFSDVDLILNYALHLLPDFKQARQLGQNLHSRFAMVLFERARHPEDAIKLAEQLSFKR